MKKIWFMALLALGTVQAQVTFRPGLRAGANFSHFTKGESNSYYNGSTYVTDETRFGSKTDFYIGFYGALRLGKYYTLQPEVDYSRQGAVYRPGNGLGSERLDISYLSTAVVNKFTFTDKFNVHLGPAVDFMVDDNFSAENEVDLAFFLGAGYNFTKNFGLEARIKKGIIPVIESNYDFYDSHTNVVFSLGATYTFDLK